MKEITYHKEGDYLIPDLAIKGSESDYHIGLYGRLKLEYMKKHQLGINDKIKVTKKGKIKITKIGYFFDTKIIV